jgi:hypothetical protein
VYPTQLGALVQALAANVTTINMYGTTETQRGVCGSHANAALHACGLTLSGNTGAVLYALLIWNAKMLCLSRDSVLLLGA